MTKDDNKKIQNITYNHLNLPTKITFVNGNTITYLYNAAGQKVNKVVTENSLVTTTEYLNGFQYVNSLMQFFPHAEGYVNATQNGAGYDYKYVFNYTDHLGNIRLSYAEDPTSKVLKIIEENHYYPFGLKHSGYNSDKMMYVREALVLKIKPVTPFLKTSYDYKYNGKEWQDELGLNVYDMDMRQYDPALSRWTAIDPITHYSQSTYCSFNGNPVFWSDPSGMEGEHYDWYLGYYVDSNRNYVSFESALSSANEKSSNDYNTPPDWFVNKKTGEVYHNEKMKKGDEKKIGEGWEHLAEEDKIKPIYNFVNSKLFKGGLLYDFKSSIFLMAFNDRKLFAQKVIEEKISETVEVKSGTFSTSITNSTVKEIWKNLTYVNSELIRQSISITTTKSDRLSPFSNSESTQKIILYTTRSEGFWDYVSKILDFTNNHSKTNLTIDINGKTF